MEFNLSKINLEQLIVNYGLKVLYAIIALVVGWVIVKLLSRLANKTLRKGLSDVSLANFLAGVIDVVLKVFLFITVASIVGINTTSFTAVIGAAGLAIGLALQGSLANFAGGVLILILKPYRIGEFIEAKGMTGTVKEIQIFYTLLNTIDNKLVIIPNGELSNSPIINYTRENKRRVDLTVGISYDDDIRTAKKILENVANNHPLVLKEPEAPTNPVIMLTSLGDSSVNIVVRSWTKTENYWTVYNEVLEEIKYKLDENNISIPFPQMDVHLNKVN